VTIAIIINTTWNIYNFRLELLKALREEGYYVICIAPYDRYADLLKEEGFEYHHIEMDNKGTNPIEDLKLTYQYYKLFRKLKPNLVLAYTIKPNIYGSVVSRLLKIPTISTITGLGTVFLNNNLSSKLARWMYKKALVKNKVFFQNRSDMALFISNHIVKESQSDLISGSGINTEKFKTSKPLPHQENVTFLMISRLLKDKGLIEYIEAIRLVKKEYPNTSFKLLGDLYTQNPTAIQEEELKSWIQEGIIEYLGYKDDVKSEIEKADVVVLPSYREGLSRVLLEAASLERPIITTNVPGCKDVVKDKKNGYLCHAKDINDLKDKMIDMISLPYKERVKMGQYGREKVIQEFDKEIVIKKYLKTIKELSTFSTQNNPDGSPQNP